MLTPSTAMGPGAGGGPRGHGAGAGTWDHPDRGAAGGRAGGAGPRLAQSSREAALLRGRGPPRLFLPLQSARPMFPISPLSAGPALEKKTGNSGAGWSHPPTAAGEQSTGGSRRDAKVRGDQPASPSCPPSEVRGDQLASPACPHPRSGGQVFPSHPRPRSGGTSRAFPPPSEGGGTSRLCPHSYSSSSSAIRTPEALTPSAPAAALPPPNSDVLASGREPTWDQP